MQVFSVTLNSLLFLQSSQQGTSLGEKSLFIYILHLKDLVV